MSSLEESSEGNSQAVDFSSRNSTLIPKASVSNPTLDPSPDLHFADTSSTNIVQSTISENPLSSAQSQSPVFSSETKTESSIPSLGGSLLQAAREEANQSTETTSSTSKLVFEGFLSDDDTDSDSETPFFSSNSPKTSSIPTTSLPIIRNPNPYLSIPEYSSKPLHSSTGPDYHGDAQSLYESIPQTNIASYDKAPSVSKPQADSTDYSLESYLNAQKILNPTAFSDSSLYMPLPSDPQNGPFIPIGTSKKISKLAIEKMHQETERLLRNTHVSVDSKIQKKDFGWLSKKLASKRLSKEPNTPKPSSQTPFSPFSSSLNSVPNISKSLSFSKNSKFDDISNFIIADNNSLYEIEISDSEPPSNNIPKSLAPSPSNHLESILANGSKSLFSMDDQSRAKLGFNTPGSKGLRDLSQALWQAVMSQNSLPPSTSDSQTVDVSLSHEALNQPISQASLPNPDSHSSTETESLPKKPLITFSKFNKSAPQSREHDLLDFEDSAEDSDNDSISSEAFDFLQLENSDLSCKTLSQNTGVQNSLPNSDSDSDSDSNNEAPSSLRKPSAYKSSKAVVIESDDESSTGYLSIKKDSDRILFTPPSKNSNSIENHYPKFLTNSVEGLTSTQDSLLLTPQSNSDSPSNKMDASFDDLAINSGGLQSILDPTNSLASPGYNSGTEDNIKILDFEPTQELAPTNEFPSLVNIHAGEEINPFEDTPLSNPTSPPRNRRIIKRSDLLKIKNNSFKKSNKKVNPLLTNLIENEAELGSEEEDEDEESKKPSALNMRFNNLKWNSNNENDPEAKDVQDDEADMFYEHLDSSDEEAILKNDPLLKNDSESEGEDDNIVKEHLKHDIETDNKMVGNLIRDLTSGRLGSKSKFGSNYLLDDDEDYNDRQTRTERMLARRGLRKKLEMQEIKDANLSKIAKNPETAAFAHAALFRMSDLKDSSNSSIKQTPSSPVSKIPGNKDDLAFDADYEEVVDDWSISLLTNTNLVNFQPSSPAPKNYKPTQKANSFKGTHYSDEPHLFSDLVDNEVDSEFPQLNFIQDDSIPASTKKSGAILPASSFASFSDFNDIIFADSAEKINSFEPVKMNKNSVTSRVKFLLSKRKHENSSAIPNSNDPSTLISNKKLALNSI
ncbi:hypothetical protein AYI68_g4651 [Smittium mucronatum]|uniref:DNA replication checkpoint mediator MRC1 domain-containing protein n=1 Tax=Smittium mucronatum TaxID=133383 RepID=A0A1R0GWH4_9FUNG|nr:hypothetical protein AYI68_g4651 [Smittium mucronatum]